MKVVVRFDQLAENLAELEKGRTSASEKLRKVHRQLIKRGTCFLLYQSSDGIAFAPSRFVGYVENKLSSHAVNPNRDGRITNAALTQLLGAPPMPDSRLEKQYLAFCSRLGITPSKTGTFGVARKYWTSSDVPELLDHKELGKIANDPSLSPTEKQQLIKARVGQGLFRNRLLTYWKSCCITSCAIPTLLRASHIKPWSKCNNRERLDMFNGLLLSPNADALFDMGFITFADSGRMISSSEITEKQLALLLGVGAASLKLKPQHARYLAYHRKHRFRGHSTPS